MLLISLQLPCGVIAAQGSFRSEAATVFPGGRGVSNQVETGSSGGSAHRTETSTQQQPSSSPPLPSKWALVVGIGSFADADVQPLHYAVSDAELIREVLVDHRYGAFPPQNVRLLTGDAATESGLKRGLNWLVRQAQPEDMVVIYLAGHSAPRSPHGPANLFIAHDSDTTEPDALYATAFPLVELSVSITRLRARHVLILLDICSSAQAVRIGPSLPASASEASLSSEALEQVRAGSGRVVLAASRDDQDALESPTLRHGYFTYYLAQAMKRHPERPLPEIFQSVRQRVSDRVKRDLRSYGEHQDPVMTRSSKDAQFAIR